MVTYKQRFDHKLLFDYYKLWSIESPACRECLQLSFSLVITADV